MKPTLSDVVRALQVLAQPGPRDNTRVWAHRVIEADRAARTP